MSQQFDDLEGFVALAWSALYGFTRIVSNRRIMGDKALSSARAWEQALGYLEQPAARMVEPGPSHARYASALFGTPGLSASDVADVYLAALAMEHGLTLATHDHGFGRFSNLSWEDPLTSD